MRMAIVVLNGISYRHELGPSQLEAAKQQIGVARGYDRLLRDKLRSATSEKFHDIAEFTSIYLNSRSAILSAAVQANGRIDWKRREHLEYCLALRNTFSLDAVNDEPVRIFAHKKTNGGFRAISKFGLKNRTAQLLVRRIMEYHFHPRDIQYTFRGVPTAISAIRERLMSGLVYYASLDIKNHFGSFEMKKLLNLLPLPKEWVERAVSGRLMAVEAGMTPASSDNLLTQARRGIPTGSGCSPIIAAYSISHLKWDTHPQMVLINYADNFLILCSDKALLSEGIGELKVVVAELPGGSFFLKEISSGHAKHGFEFLGHDISYSANGLSIRPGAPAVNSIYAKLERIDEQLPYGCAKYQAETTKELVLVGCQLLKGWISAFKASDHITEYEEAMLTLLSQSAGLPYDVIEKLYKGAAAKGFSTYSLKADPWDERWTS